MPFNINNFRSIMEGELASPTLFEVSFVGPQVTTKVGERLTLMCNQAQFPGRAFGTTDYATHGPVRKTPNQNIYDDIVLSFFCSKEMKEKEFMQDWQNAVCNASNPSPFSGFRFRYPDEYYTDLTIKQFDREGNVTYTATVIDAWPLMVNPLDANWGGTDSFHNLSVTFAYKYWKQEKIPTGPNALFPISDIAPKAKEPVFHGASGSWEQTELDPGYATNPGRLVPYPGGGGGFSGGGASGSWAPQDNFLLHNPGDTTHTESPPQESVRVNEGISVDTDDF
jgi:hypothetical protein